jgi:hypothetical protein
MTDIIVRQVEEFELDTWDAFVASCAAGTLYHTSLWRKVLNTAYGSGDYSIAAAYTSSGIAGGYCALTRTRLGVKTAVTPLLTPYTGYLLPASPVKPAAPSGTTDSPTATLLQLTRHARRFRYQSLQCAPGMPALSSLAAASYQLTPRLTVEINLSLPEDELWQNLSGPARRNIKKAQRAEFTITDKWDPEQAFELFRQTFARHDQPCEVPRAYFDEIATGALLRDNRYRFCAWRGDEFLGFLVALHYGRTVYYQLAASTDEARTAGVPSLLIWEMLRACRQPDFDRFDFLGANTPGIAKFKEGFGATPVPHILAELCTSRRILLTRGMRRWVTAR